jgi:DNA adenine methylase
VERDGPVLTLHAALLEHVETPEDRAKAEVKRERRMAEAQKLPKAKRDKSRPKKLTAFGWVGGKFHQLDWLLPLLEPEVVEVWIDVFGGGACVTANRKPAPVMIYNDSFGEVTTFFTALRDEREKLIEAIKATPWAREEYEKAIHGVEGEGELDPVERARRFYVRARQSRFGVIHDAKRGQWSTTPRTSQRLDKWQASETDLRELSERFKRVQIENRDALKLIEEHGQAPECLIYCDPPYLHDARREKRAYGVFELSEADHRNLAEALNACKAKVAVSGYEHPLYDELYPAPRWTKIVGPERRARVPRTKGTYRTPEPRRPEPSARGKREARRQPEPVTGMNRACPETAEAVRNALGCPTVGQRDAAA